jgi:hypothetical protein
MTSQVLKLAIAAMVGWMLFSTPIRAQDLPPAPKANGSSLEWFETLRGSPCAFHRSSGVANQENDERQRRALISALSQRMRCDRFPAG